MAFNKKLTLKFGAKRHQVAVSAGTDIASTVDGVEINIEQAVMSKADAIDLIDKIREKIIAGPWPID